MPLILFAQEERLRYEIIDVFKSYSPVVANSFKISTQPIYDDTLQEKIIPNKPILSRNLFIEESINFEYPSKFKFNQLNNYYASHASIELGSHTFFKQNFIIAMVSQCDIIQVFIFKFLVKIIVYEVHILKTQW